MYLLLYDKMKEVLIQIWDTTFSAHWAWLSCACRRTTLCKVFLIIFILYLDHHLHHNNHPQLDPIWSNLIIKLKITVTKILDLMIWSDACKRGSTLRLVPPPQSWRELSPSISSTTPSAGVFRFHSNYQFNFQSHWQSLGLALSYCQLVWKKKVWSNILWIASQLANAYDLKT